MGRIEEMASVVFPLPPLYNEDQRKSKEYAETWERARDQQFGFITGANAVLNEIETRIEMSRHACMQTAEVILESVEMTIKELKGEWK